MIFNIETKPIQDDIPMLEEGLTELINFHINRLAVNYIGKSNPSIPAVISKIVCSMLSTSKAVSKHLCLLFRSYSQ